MLEYVLLNNNEGSVGMKDDISVGAAKLHAGLRSLKCLFPRSYGSV